MKRKSTGEVEQSAEDHQKPAEKEERPAEVAQRVHRESVKEGVCEGKEVQEVAEQRREVAP